MDGRWGVAVAAIAFSRTNDDKIVVLGETWPDHPAFPKDLKPFQSARTPIGGQRVQGLP